MPLPPLLQDRLRLPAIVAPMFLISNPALVIATCRAGLVGTFPALNQRTTEGFVAWLEEVGEGLAATPRAAPFGVNLIVHRSNKRLEADLGAIVSHRVPLVITSLGAVRDVVDAVHSYGGLVFHDVISRRHAEKAGQAGVDGIVAVAAGAGGHAGTLSPFALVTEIRQVFAGPIALAGALSTGAHIAAARMLGADLAYLGTRFIATEEARAEADYKRMLVEAKAADILYTPAISGVPANFLKPSIRAAGLDPDGLGETPKLDLEHEAKAWKTVWSAGQGVGAIGEVLPVAELCERLEAEYRAALHQQL